MIVTFDYKKMNEYEKTIHLYRTHCLRCGGGFC